MWKKIVEKPGKRETKWIKWNDKNKIEVENLIDFDINKILCYKRESRNIIIGDQSNSQSVRHNQPQPASHH